VSDASLDGNFGIGAALKQATVMLRVAGFDG